MTPQPDTLFRNKLENFLQHPPATAWSRIERKLSKSRKKIIWMRAAAGVTLLAAAAMLLWPAEKTSQQITKTNERPAGKSNNTSQKPNVKKEEKRLDPDKSIVPLQAVQTETIRKSKKQLSVKPLEKPVPDSVLLPDSQEPTVLTAEVSSSLENTESRKIVYTADEVNSKFLKKKLSPEATPGLKDASGIQKLIGLAYTAKNSEAPLGDLRQKKDDLLALNFGNKKGEN